MKYPIPTIIKPQGVEPYLAQGALFGLPSELVHKTRIQNQVDIKRLGWSDTLFNYRSYTFNLSHSTLATFPWLFLRDRPRPSKVFPGYQPIMSSMQIEALAASLADIWEMATSASSDDVNLLVHDLRAISSLIEGHAFAVSRILGYQTYNHPESENLNVRINSVRAAQTMLRLRTDALNFIGNPQRLDDFDYIPAYKKVHKVVKAFQVKASEHKKSINIEGQSYNQIYGPPVFELIPFTIIDNAIKYSPLGSQINVKVEDFAFSTKISVSSLGPKILDEERDKIFARKFRGAAALDSPAPGSGVGLSLVSELLEHFKGSIDCRQATEVELADGREFYMTSFSVTVPSAKRP